MTLRAVTFDLDGTLYAKRALRWRYMIKNFSHLRTLRVARQVREAFRGEVFPTGEAFVAAEVAELAERLGVDPKAAAQMHHDVFVTRLVPLLERVGPRSDARASLLRLTAAGLKIGVVSDFPVREKLRALGLADVGFSITVAADATGALKPYPGAFERALAEMGVGPAEALHVGDRADTDERGARAAGMASLVLGRDVNSLSAAVDRILSDAEPASAG